MKTFDNPEELKEIIKYLREAGLNKRNITRVLQLAELTGEEPSAIVSRYRTLEEEVRKVMVS